MFKQLHATVLVIVINIRVVILRKQIFPIMTQNPFEQIDNRLNNIESLLLDIKHRKSDVPEQEQLMNVDQACELLGISKPTIYLFCQKQIIPFSKPTGKRIYFRRDELLNWATSRTEQAEPELIRLKKSRK